MIDPTTLTDEELSDHTAACSREMWRRRYDKPALQAVLTALTDSSATSDNQLAQEVLQGLRMAGYRVIKAEPLALDHVVIDPRDTVVEITEEWTP